MSKPMRRRLMGALVAALIAQPACALELKEVTSLAETHEGLPPVAERAPLEPRVIELQTMGREIGRHGGDLQTIIPRAKDVRLAVVWGYARLLGYDESFELIPDILRAVEVEEGRIFTFHLRKGHRWSDGHPFTTEDFRYWWRDVALNEALSPKGPPRFMLVEGERPEVDIFSETEIRFSWSKPNPVFLTKLAAARPPFIYRPAHFLKRYHASYADRAMLDQMVAARKVTSWASLHNDFDNMYKFNIPELPTLQPWVNTTQPPANRFVLVRNPYFHRVDETGQQLPYIDRIVMTVADGKLIAAKANAGESDLQARGLSFSDVTILKQGERRNHYRTFLWSIAKGSHMALYPNLTTNDPVWRALMRDVRFRRALSLGVDRRIINRSLYFGLGTEGGNTLLGQSPLFDEANASAWSSFDPETANTLLDEIGLRERDANGIRLLPDGRPLEIIVETAGESADETDMLQLVDETWREIGAKIFIKPSSREVMRNRAYSGQMVMAVWSGWNNGVATADMPPEDLAPVRQDNLSWPKWGQHRETKGASGEPIDMAPAARLLELYDAWTQATNREARETIWREMLAIHAQELFSIGTVCQVRQPVVVSDRLRNVPEEAVYGWDPGAQFGMHLMDAFWFAEEGETTADAGVAQ